MSADSPAAYGAMAALLGGGDAVSFGAAPAADMTAAGNPGTEAGAVLDMALLADCRDLVVTAGRAPALRAVLCHMCMAVSVHEAARDTLALVTATHATPAASKQQSRVSCSQVSVALCSAHTDAGVLYPGGVSRQFNHLTCSVLYRSSS